MSPAVLHHVAAAQSVHFNSADSDASPLVSLNRTNRIQNTENNKKVKIFGIVAFQLKKISYSFSVKNYVLENVWISFA